jgi:iron complex outermembrane receptor protein
VIQFLFIIIKKNPFFVFSKISPSIYSQSDNGQGNGYAYMRLRGLDQTRINYNLNGIPLNEMEDQGIYFSNMPGFYNYLNSISVQRGVGSSKYGTTSIGRNY